MAAAISIPHFFVAGQLQSISSDRMPMCSSPRVAVLISSAVMHSGISLHDSIALMVKHMPGISLSLFHVCVWIANL